METHWAVHTVLRGHSYGWWYHEITTVHAATPGGRLEARSAEETNSKQHTLSPEADSHSAGHLILKVHYPIHDIRRLVSILSQNNPVPTYFLNILILAFRLKGCMCFSSLSCVLHPRPSLIIFWWRAQVMKLIFWIFLPSFPFLPLRFKCTPSMELRPSREANSRSSTQDILSTL